MCKQISSRISINLLTRVVNSGFGTCGDLELNTTLIFTAPGCAIEFSLPKSGPSRAPPALTTAEHMGQSFVSSPHRGKTGLSRLPAGSPRDHADAEIRRAPSAALEHCRASFPLAPGDTRKPRFQHAAQHWQGSVDDILLLEISKAGPLVRARVDGILDGIKEVFPAVEKCRIVLLDAKGECRAPLECLRKYLRDNAAKYIMVGGADDPSALGALRAFQECGRGAHCAVGGIECRTGGPRGDARDRNPVNGSGGLFSGKGMATPLSASPRMPCRERTQPQRHSLHELVTPENVNRLYPNGALFVRLAQEYA